MQHTATSIRQDDLHRGRVDDDLAFALLTLDRSNLDDRLRRFHCLTAARLQGPRLVAGGAG